MFIASLGLFHVLEYLQTSLWNPDKLSLDCASRARAPGGHRQTYALLT